MENKNHLTMENLLALSSFESERKSAQPGHNPEGCAECERAVRSFRLIRTALRRSLWEEPASTGNCPEEMDLIDAIEDRGEALWREGILSHAGGCAVCFERLAFYFRSSREMRETPPLQVPAWLMEKAGGERPAPYFAVLAPMENIFRMIYLFFKSPVAGYGLAALFMALLIANKTLLKPVVNLSPAPKLTIYKEETPGEEFGFQYSGGREEQTRPFEGMSVKAASEGTLLFIWPQIKEAAETQFSLFSVREGRQEKILEEKVRDNQLKVNISRLEKRSLYRWTLSGDLGGGGKFHAASDFVCLED